VQNKMTLEGVTRVKIKDWMSTVCFMRTSTVQFGFLANLPMVLVIININSHVELLEEMLLKFNYFH